MTANIYWSKLCGKRDVCHNTLKYLAFAEVFPKYCTTGSLFFSDLYPGLKQNNKFCHGLEKYFNFIKIKYFYYKHCKCCHSYMIWVRKNSSDVILKWGGLQGRVFSPKRASGLIYQLYTTVSCCSIFISTYCHAFLGTHCHCFSVRVLLPLYQFKRCVSILYFPVNFIPVPFITQDVTITDFMSCQVWTCNDSINSLHFEEPINLETLISDGPFTFAAAALLKLFFFSGVFWFSVTIKQRCQFLPSTNILDFFCCNGRWFRSSDEYS